MSIAVLNASIDTEGVADICKAVRNCEKNCSAVHCSWALPSAFVSSCQVVLICVDASISDNFCPQLPCKAGGGIGNSIPTSLLRCMHDVWVPCFFPNFLLWDCDYIALSNHFLVPFLHVYPAGESPSKSTTVSRHRACHWRWVDNPALSSAASAVAKICFGMLWPRARMRTEPVLEEGVAQLQWQSEFLFRFQLWCRAFRCTEVWNTPLGKETIWKHLDLRPPSSTKKCVPDSGAWEIVAEQTKVRTLYSSDSCPVLRSLRKRYFKIPTAEWIHWQVTNSALSGWSGIFVRESPNHSILGIRQRLDFMPSAKKGSWCERKSCWLAAV